MFKNDKEKKSFLLSVGDLQMFAGGEEPPADNGKGEESDPVTYTEEDLQTRIKEALAKAKTDHEAEIAAARSEAEKLAKMTADEKAKFEFEQREQKVEEKEKAIAIRELKVETLKTLSEKSIPQEVLELVLADNAENTAKKIDTFKTVFDKAVQAAVEERLSGKSPSLGNGNTATTAADEQIRSQFSSALKGVR